MTNKKVEKILKNEIKEEVPNVLDSILLNCKERKNNMNGSETNSNIKRKWFKPAFALALTAFVVAFGILYSGYNSFYSTDSIIEFDVNPSVELKVNKKERVIDAKALNEDGEKILKDMDLKRSDLNVAVNAIIGSMYKEGYISEIKNSILVSVKNDDMKKSKELQQELSKRINEILNGYSVSPAVLTQNYSDDIKTKSQANKNNISEGKAKFISRILKENLTNKDGKKYTFDTLSKLTINELNVILNSKNKTVSKVTSTGKASTKGYIGKDKAKSISFSDAGVSSKNVDIEIDYEDGKMIYEVEFTVNGNEYEYEIDAVTGKILDKTIEIDDEDEDDDIDDDDDYKDNKVSKSNTSSKSSSNSSNKSSSKNSSSSKKKNTSNSSSTNYIGVASAKSIAFASVGGLIK